MPDFSHGNLWAHLSGRKAKVSKKGIVINDQDGRELFFISPVLKAKEGNETKSAQDRLVDYDDDEMRQNILVMTLARPLEDSQERMSIFEDGIRIGRKIAEYHGMNLLVPIDDESKPFRNSFHNYMVHNKIFLPILTRELDELSDNGVVPDFVFHDFFKVTYKKMFSDRTYQKYTLDSTKFIFHTPCAKINLVIMRDHENLSEINGKLVPSKPYDMSNIRLVASNRAGNTSIGLDIYLTGLPEFSYNNIVVDHIIFTNYSNFYLNQDLRYIKAPDADIFDKLRKNMKSNMIMNPSRSDLRLFPAGEPFLFNKTELQSFARKKLNIEDENHTVPFKDILRIIKEAHDIDLSEDIQKWKRFIDRHSDMIEAKCLEKLEHDIDSISFMLEINGIDIHNKPAVSGTPDFS